MESSDEINKQAFKLGQFTVEPDRNLVFSGSEKYALEPRIMDVLCVLASQPGDVLSREDLIDTVWKVEYGADESLTRAISLLRKTFRTAGATEQYIETIPKRGYRLSQAVEQIVAPTHQPELTSADKEPELSAINLENSTSRNLKPSVTINSRHKETPRRKRPIAIFAIIALSVMGLLLSFGRNDDSNNDLPVAALERSLAVLPFEDYSPTNDQGYFADGIAEELLSALSQLEGLRVASRTSSFTYRSKDVKTDEIAKALDVNHILEGSVRKSGGNVRVTAQLIDTRSDRHIWSETYDRTLTAENIFAIQDDISRAIASELKIQMKLPETPASPPTESTEAYEAYLRAKSQYAPRSKDGINAAIASLQRSIEIDPNFSAAHATLARVYMMAQEYGGLNNSDAYALASVHLDKALKLAPTSSESLTAKAQVLFQQGQYPLALEYYNVATVANPLDADAWRGKGLSLRELGQMPAALETLERAKQIEPLSSMTYMNISNIEMYKEDLVSAIENVETSLQLDPNNVAASEQLAALTLLTGDYAEAHRLYKENELKYPRITNNLQRLYYGIGRPDLEARNMNWYNKAYLAFTAGDAKSAVEFALNQNSGPTRDVIEVLYNAGNIDAAYRTLRSNADQLAMYVGNTPISAFGEETAILYYNILVAKKDPRAVLIYEKLAARFDNKKPSDFVLPSSLWAGASWQILNNNPTAALDWLKYMNEKGQLWRHIEFDPLFDTLREAEAFAPLWERMEDNAAKYGAEIDSQLNSAVLE